MENKPRLLRKAGMGHQGVWTIDELRAGFMEFFRTYGRYPTTPEIDKFEYLPSARSLQRSFGGAKKLRENIGLDVGVLDYGKGEHRSSIGRRIHKRAFEVEKEIEHQLVKHFGIEFVHVERPFGSSKERLDFYIFAKNMEFGVDVFFAQDLNNLKKVINIKQKKYNKLNFVLYLVNMNLDILQQGIDNAIKNKKERLVSNVKVMNKNNFLTIIHQITPNQLK